MLDDLVKIALIGTGRAGAATLPPPLPGALGQALAALPPAAGPEASLLRSAALASAYEACGRAPAEAGTPPPPPAPPDGRPACTDRAGELLGRLLAMTNTPAKHQLLDEWLGHAARAGRRAPHAALPALLDYGAARRASQTRVAAVVDERGRWLTAQNPRWHFGVVGDDVDVRSAWSTGSPPQRLAALRRARRDDPAAARELVQSTWKEDGADDRAAFVAALADGLSAADEPFLESALDDRSKQVRAAAADLLVRLPASAFVARMAARAGAMLAPKGKSIVVTLPTKYDPAWARDGVTEKPAERIGQKQWWLRQVVAAVPPSHWSAAWRLGPAACIKAAKGDFAELLTAAWSEAAARARDADWAAALLRASYAERPAVPVELFDALPADQRPVLFAEAVEAARLDLAAVARVLSGTEFVLDRRAALSLIEWVGRHVAGSKVMYDYGLPQVLNEAALRVPPAMYDEFAKRWIGPYWDANARTLEQFLQVLQLRRDVQQEFAT